MKFLALALLTMLCLIHSVTAQNVSPNAAPLCQPPEPDIYGR